MNEIYETLPNGYRYLTADEVEWCLTAKGDSWRYVAGVRNGDPEMVDYAVPNDYENPFSNLPDMDIECPQCQAPPGVPCCH